jgi:hypothetical protein
MSAMINADNVVFGDYSRSVNSRLIWNRKNDPGAFSFRATKLVNENGEVCYSAHILNTSYSAYTTAKTLREAYNAAMNMVVEYLNR